MGFPLDYYFIDHKRDISYPEQRVAVKQLTRYRFIVSMGVADGTVFFDPKKKFSDNIMAICDKDHDRAHRFKEGSAFRRAFYAGMCTSHDEKIVSGGTIPILYFDTEIDLRKDGRNTYERLAPLSVHQNAASVYGSYSFKSFQDKDMKLVKSEDMRLGTANEFLKRLQEIPDVFNYCLRNTHAV